MSKTKRFHAQGFDRTTYDRSDRSYRIRCSQCEAMCINGIPCHERGCPNWKRRTREEGA